MTSCVLLLVQVPDHSVQDSDDELQMVPELEHSSISNAFCPTTSLGGEWTAPLQLCCAQETRIQVPL
jgi:hypothetical protein